MKLKAKQALVTGAGGFIGSHLVEQLLEREVRVRAFVHYNSRGCAGWLDTLPDADRDRVEIVAGDIQDGDAVSRAVRDVEVVFHLASLIGIPYSYIHPRHVLQTNVVGGFNVLESCRTSGSPKIIHVSTSEVYGTAQSEAIPESHPLCPQSPYAASKLAADKMAESYQKTFDMDIVIGRPFNCFGPRQSNRAVIPTIISQCLSGNEIRLGRTDTVRDYTFVTDTVRGLIRLAEVDDLQGKTINLGSGRENTIESIAETVRDLCGRERLKIIQDRDRIRPAHSEVDRLLSDSRQAKQLLGWVAETDFRSGLEKTVEWFRIHQTDSGRSETYRI